MKVSETFSENIDKWLEELLCKYKPIEIKDDKVIRDAVYGFNLFYKHEVNIIDSPLLQRLRGIFQTALALYTYPSAVHSRFEHSLSCVGLSEKILQSIAAKNRDKIKNGTHTWAEVRMAALLHDAGHCALSHATEKIYGRFQIFEDLKKEDRKTFNDAQPHEIITYFIVKSKNFKKCLWDPIKDLYTSKGIPFCNLSEISPDRIANMILGIPPENNPELKFLAQIINGPFDVDKLDYLKRDGYFTGLQTAMDIDRLFITVGVSRNKETSEYVLSTDLSGVTVLEQVLFNKMLIFASVYHHHKVRSAFLRFLSVFELLKKERTQIKGCDFSSPFHFLRIDDYEIFNSLHTNLRLNEAIQQLKHRELFRRALIISRDTLKDEDSWRTLLRKLGGKGLEEINIKDIDEFSAYVRKEVAKRAQENEMNIHFDVPEPPRFTKAAKETKVRRSKIDDDIISLDDVYPTKGWVSGYAMYRYRIYVFCLPSKHEKVAKAAYEVLLANNIRLNPKAFHYAKQEESLIVELGLHK